MVYEGEDVVLKVTCDRNVSVTLFIFCNGVTASKYTVTYTKMGIELDRDGLDGVQCANTYIPHYSCGYRNSHTSCTQSNQTQHV